MLPSSERAPSSKSLKGQWGRWGAFCLLVAVVAACGKDNDPIRDVPITGEQGGSSSTGKGGADGDDEKDVAVRVQRLEADENSLTVHLEGIGQKYLLSCATTPELREKNLPEDVSQLPDAGTSYYLDDVFEPNAPRGFGCDLIDCVPVPSHFTFPRRGVLLTGTRAAPDDVGEAGGASGGEEVSTFESYERKGPFTFSVSYYPDADCLETPIDVGPFSVELKD